jgi:hypothetical protein
LEKNTPSTPSSAICSKVDVEQGRRHRLDAEVERRDGEPLVPHRRHDVRLGGGDLGGQRGAGHRGG